MLKKAGARSGRVISEGDLAETFGIDIDGFDSGPAAAAALPPEAELVPEKRDEKEDIIIFEESQAALQKSDAKLILKRAQRKAAAKFSREPHEKPRLKKRPLIERIKSLLGNIENVSSVAELEALSGVLTKLSKITAKKIELLKALDEIKVF